MTASSSEIPHRTDGAHVWVRGHGNEVRRALIQTDGYVASGYELVAEAFAINLQERGDTGASFAAFVRDEKVIELWGGLADAETRRPWKRETPCVIFSGTKALTAVCVLMLHDRGQLDVDAPVSVYWPEFGAEGKARVTVRDVLTHQGRLPGLRKRVGLDQLLQPGVAAALLAKQPQETDPRAALIYHPLTYGWLCGEIVARVTGRDLGEFFKSEVAMPLALDTTIGTASERRDAAAVLQPHRSSGQSMAWNPSLREGDELLERIWDNPRIFGTDLVYNSVSFLSGQIPGANAVSTAVSMARFYAALLSSADPLLSLELLDMATRPQVRGIDLTTGQEMAYGLGFAVQTSKQEFGPPGDGFGHSGAGGSMHGAWKDQQTAFSYVTNDLRDFADPDPRAQSLLNALFTCVRATMLGQ